MKVENASLEDLLEGLTSGEIAATELTKAYIARIKAYDQGGPKINSVREVNPDALSIAAKLDGVKPTKSKPLAGLPILIKDNIASGDRQHTTAGSLALADAYAKKDATVTARLRKAGAIILGKANLTEFANILAVGMPAGYSSLGGQVKNAFAPDQDENRIPIVHPGGSSAGSGVAVAIGAAAATIGTETSGSLLSPATQSGVVTVKPTVGLISRAGILPISHSQDTAGPMTRTVRDSALLLNVLATVDPLDKATARQKRPKDYLDHLDKDGLKGARIGVPSDPSDPGNDVYYSPLSPRAKEVMSRTIEALQDLGATIIRANIPTAGWIGGAGTEIAVLNRNHFSPTYNQVQRAPIVFVYELKNGLEAYLKKWAKGTAMKTIDDIIAFNRERPVEALRFGQDLFLAAAETRGDLSEPEYKSARRMDLKHAKTLGLDAYMDMHKLDAVLFPANAGAGIAAKPGYPSVQVPAGFIAGMGGKDTPDYPLGATFAGRAWSEAKLLRFAYAFEQATHARRMPPGVPAL
ncbi:MAG: amidase [Alphaproteobacteria bacterium]|nr:amidase [Alphaproteobacteria bacterium]